MDRRSFLGTALAISATTALPGRGLGLENSTPLTGWRTFEVTSRIEITNPEGVTQLWLPLPSVDAPEWVRNEGESWSGNADSVMVARDKKYGAGILHAVWKSAGAIPALEVISRCSTRDRATDFANPSNSARPDPRLQTLYTAATELIPNDGIVRATAAGIVKGADIDIARPGQSMSGWWKTRRAIRRRAAADSATSASCLNPAT
jgi:hypothetical protein